jgi:hypothetical protein
MAVICPLLGQHVLQLDTGRKCVKERGTEASGYIGKYLQRHGTKTLLGTKRRLYVSRLPLTRDIKTGSNSHCYLMVSCMALYGGVMVGFKIPKCPSLSWVETLGRGTWIGLGAIGISSELHGLCHSLTSHVTYGPCTKSRWLAREPKFQSSRNRSQPVAMMQGVTGVTALWNLQNTPL